MACLCRRSATSCDAALCQRFIRCCYSCIRGRSGCINEVFRWWGMTIERHTVVHRAATLMCTSDRAHHSIRTLSAHSNASVLVLRADMLGMRHAPASDLLSEAKSVASPLWMLLLLYRYDRSQKIQIIVPVSCSNGSPCHVRHTHPLESSAPKTRACHASHRSSMISITRGGRRSGLSELGIAQSQHFTSSPHGCTRVWSKITCARQQEKRHRDGDSTVLDSHGAAKRQDVG